MRKVMVFITTLTLFPSFAFGYDLGSMTCRDIGEFASATVAGKKNGRPYKDAVALVKKKTKGYAVEKKNLLQVVDGVYKQPYGKNLSEEGARMAFTADCEAQR